MAAPAYRDLSAQKVVASSAASPAPAAKAADRRFVSAVSPSAEVPAGPAELRLIVAADLRIDGNTQMRAAMDPAVVDEYAEIMTAAGGWGPFPPCEAVFDGVDIWLWRGFHRRAAYVKAAQAAGWSVTVPVLVRNGSLREAVLLAAADNADHGLRRSVADKQKAVDRLLADPEWGAWSDGKIARACHVSGPFVAGRRRILAASAAMAGSLGVPAAERKYTDRYGNEKVMNTGAIAQGNRDRAAARAESGAGGAAAGAAHGVGAKLGTCAVCHRPLSDPDHVANGCGPVCAAKLAAAGMAQSGGLEDDGDQAGQASVAASDWAPASGGLRGRLLGIVDDLTDYVQATGDTAGAEALRRACLAAAERLQAAGV